MSFLFCTVLARGADRKVESRAGIMFETPRGLYEIYINAEGDEFFFFNMRSLKGLPIDKVHVVDTEKIFKKFNMHRDDLQKYAITSSRSLWWELKDKITLDNKSSKLYN